MESVYDDIAQSWHSFKRKPFPPVVQELAATWKGRILDVGCGNARNLLAFDGELFGIDNSKEMVAIARDHAKKLGKKATFLLADATALPFKDAYFDHVLCVAMLHHLTPDKQVIALKEMRRVLKPTGTVLITVWNKWQHRFMFGSTERMVPWTTNGKTVERYYFLHNRFSLKTTVKKAGFSVRSVQGTFGPNIIVLASRDA